MKLFNFNKKIEEGFDTFFDELLLTILSIAIGGISVYVLFSVFGWKPVIHKALPLTQAVLTGVIAGLIAGALFIIPSIPGILLAIYLLPKKFQEYPESLKIAFMAGVMSVVGIAVLLGFDLYNQIVYRTVSWEAYWHYFLNRSPEALIFLAFPLIGVPIVSLFTSAARMFSSQKQIQGV